MAAKAVRILKVMINVFNKRVPYKRAVFTLIEDHSEDLYLRLCTYTGLKEDWEGFFKAVN